MAWFETGDGGDICADEVMDDVADALKAIFSGADGAPDDLSDLLRLWQDALNAESRAILAEAGASAFRLRADLIDPAEGKAEAKVRAVPSSAEPSAVGPRGRVLAALRLVATTYRDATGRSPRASELAYALSFGFAEAEVARRLGVEPQQRIRVVIEPYAEAEAP